MSQPKTKWRSPGDTITVRRVTGTGRKANTQPTNPAADSASHYTNVDAMMTSVTMMSSSMLTPTPSTQSTNTTIATVAPVSSMSVVPEEDEDECFGSTVSDGPSQTVQALSMVLNDEEDEQTDFGTDRPVLPAAGDEPSSENPTVAPLPPPPSLSSNEGEDEDQSISPLEKSKGTVRGRRRTVNPSMRNTKLLTAKGTLKNRNPIQSFSAAAMESVTPLSSSTSSSLSSGTPGATPRARVTARHRTTTVAHKMLTFTPQPKISDELMTMGVCVDPEKEMQEAIDIDQQEAEQHIRAKSAANGAMMAGSRKPDLRSPLEIAVEHRTTAIVNAQGLPHLMNGRETLGLALLETPDSINHDSISGLRLASMAASDPAQLRKALPGTDYNRRFVSHASSTVNDMHAQIVARLRGLQEAMYQDVVEQSNPSLRQPYLVSLKLAIMDMQPYIDRQRAALAPKNVIRSDGVAQLEQGELPDLELVSIEHMRQSLYPPTSGQRPCANQDYCIAFIKSGVNTNVSAMAPSQTTIGNPVTRRSRNPAPHQTRCREFMLPSQLRKFEEDRTLPDTQGYCLVCIMHNTELGYHTMMVEGSKEAQRRNVNDPVGVDSSIRQRMEEVSVRLRNMLDQGKISADKYEEKLAQVVKIADMRVRFERFTSQLPFHVIISPDQFPEAACLQMTFGDQDSVITMPFPAISACDLRWVTETTTNGITMPAHMTITFKNFRMALVSARTA